MQISDLVPIGKLGNSINEEGFITFKKNRKFQFFNFEIKDVFLIFTDYRVRYVTIDKVKLNHNLHIKFLETEVMEEAIQDKNVFLAIPKNNIKQILNTSESLNYVGMEVDYEGCNLGCVVDVITNSFQSNFVILAANKKEIMIPDVDFYILKKDTKQRILYVKNIQDLLEL